MRAMTKFAREARRAPRSRHDSVMEILGDPGSGPAGGVRLRDVSARGVRFAAARGFAVGAPIRARLRLMKAGVLEIEGRVIRAEEKTNYALYAVEFGSVLAVRP